MNDFSFRKFTRSFTTDHPEDTDMRNLTQRRQGAKPKSMELLEFESSRPLRLGGFA
jgi:hypothetical protein